MASSLSSLVNNRSEGNDKIKCKHGHGYKKVKLVELNSKILTVFLNTETLTLKRQSHKMVKHAQTIRRQQPTN